MLLTVLLRILHTFGSVWAAESALRDEARLRRGSVGESEFADRLQSLLDAGYVEKEVDKLTRDRRWRITADGQTYLKAR